MRKVIRLRTASDQILISGATLRVVRENGKITVVIDAPPNVSITHEIGGEVSELVVEGAEIITKEINQ